MDQIVFLHLKLKDGAITLLRSSVMPGRLKLPIGSDRKGEIQLELTAMDGSSLWSEVMSDPTLQRFEYEDPAHPGTLKIKEIKVAEAEFTVRVPHHVDARQLKIHRLGTPATATEVRTVRTARKLLGTVAIPRAEGTH
jgi:hypothetical protein